MAGKSTLGVKGSTTSLGVYAELGRYSLLEQRHINILKLYIRFINLDSSRYAYRALEMLINDADSCVSNWVSIVRSLMALYRKHTTDNSSFVKSKVSSHFRSKVTENLKEQIILNKKLCIYASFKTVYKFEHYLDLIPSKKK